MYRRDVMLRPPLPWEVMEFGARMYRVCSDELQAFRGVFKTNDNAACKYKWSVRYVCTND